MEPGGAPPLMPGGMPMIPDAFMPPGVSPMGGFGAGGTTATPGVAPGPQGRGFIIKISGTTPNASAVQLVDETLVKGLLATAKEKAAGRPYRFEKVVIVSLKPLRDNQQKIQFIKSEWDRAVQAKQSGQFTAAPMTGGFGGFGGGFGGPLGGPFGPGGLELDMPGPMRGLPTLPNAGAPAAGMPTGNEPYMDREFPDEDIRDDQEFVVVAMVLVDPPALAATEEPTTAPAAPASPTAAAR